MNIIELEELLRKRNINASNRLICNIWGMDEASYSRKKKALTEVKQKNIEQLEEHFAIKLFDNSSENCVDIEYYSDVWASCGNGAVVFEESAEKLSVPKSLIQNYSSSSRYSVINARGDSMQPFIQNFDKLIVEHWNGGQIIDNCIYVFRYANELFVKRLVKNITQIVIKSDNPLYEPIKITDKDQDFEVIGQIVGLMRDLR
jgi:phage repressor protein C with HTH and peptisase S24 domain